MTTATTPQNDSDTSPQSSSLTFAQKRLKFENRSNQQHPPPLVSFNKVKNKFDSVEESSAKAPFVMLHTVASNVRTPKMVFDSSPDDCLKQTNVLKFQCHTRQKTLDGNDNSSNIIEEHKELLDKKFQINITPAENEPSTKILLLQSSTLGDSLPLSINSLQLQNSENKLSHNQPLEASPRSSPQPSPRWEPKSSPRALPKVITPLSSPKSFPVQQPTKQKPTPESITKIISDTHTNGSNIFELNDLTQAFSNNCDVIESSHGVRMNSVVEVNAVGTGLETISLSKDIFQSKSLISYPVTGNEKASEVGTKNNILYFDDDFSDVFQGKLVTVMAKDLTKRVLDRVNTSQKTADYKVISANKAGKDEITATQKELLNSDCLQVDGANTLDSFKLNDDATTLFDTVNTFEQDLQDGNENECLNVEKDILNENFTVVDENGHDGSNDCAPVKLVTDQNESKMNTKEETYEEETTQADGRHLSIPVCSDVNKDENEVVDLYSSKSVDILPENVIKGEQEIPLENQVENISEVEFSGTSLRKTLNNFFETENSTDNSHDIDDLVFVNEDYLSSVDCADSVASNSSSVILTVIPCDMDDIILKTVSADDAGTLANGDFFHPFKTTASSEKRRLRRRMRRSSDIISEQRLQHRHCEQEDKQECLMANLISYSLATPDENHSSEQFLIEPLLKRRHKMARRVASGKIPIPKAFLSAVSTSTKVMTAIEKRPKKSIEGKGEKVDNYEKSHNTEVAIDVVEVLDLTNSFDSSTKKSQDIHLAAKSASMKRQKLVDRVASGKVPVPKAFLTAPPMSLVKKNLSTFGNSTKNKDSMAPSIIMAISTETSIELFASPNRLTGPSTDLNLPDHKCNTMKQQTILTEKLNPSTLLRIKENYADTTSERKNDSTYGPNIFIPEIDDPCSGLLKGELIQLSSPSKTSPDREKNDARRLRRNLRRSPVSWQEKGENEDQSYLLEVSQNATEEITEAEYVQRIECDANQNPNQISNNCILEKHLVNAKFLNTQKHELLNFDAKVEFKELRCDYGVNSKILDQEVKSSDDYLDFTSTVNFNKSMDKEEANELFPYPSLNDIETNMNTLEPSCSIEFYSKPLNLEPPWDVDGASVLNSILEDSQIRNGNSSKEDRTPLLELDVISSDATQISTKDSDLIASEKLLSQRERIHVYTSKFGSGEGEDSSGAIEYDCQQEMSESNDGPFEYEAVQCGDGLDSNSNEEDREASDTFDFIEFGRGSYEEFSTADCVPAVHVTDKSLRWFLNPDAISDIDEESDFFDTKNSVTSGGNVVGLSFLLKSKEDDPLQHPTYQSTSCVKDSGDTENLTVIEKQSFKDSNPECDTINAKVFKIAPSLPETLFQSEDSRRTQNFSEMSLMNKVDMIKSDKRHMAHSDVHQEKVAFDFECSPSDYQSITEKKSSLSGQEIQPYSNVSILKSPTRRKPLSISEELNLTCHKRMAEKFAKASSKAAKKFEEEYSHYEQDVQQNTKRGRPTTEKSSNRFFCVDSSMGDNLLLKPFIIDNPNDVLEDENPTVNTPITGSVWSSTGVMELVGGAFSPWKIPDRGEEDSNASSSRVTYADESYVNATAVALSAIHSRNLTSFQSMADCASSTEEKGSIDVNLIDHNKANESFEVTLNCTHHDGSSLNIGAEEKHDSLLSGVLLWLFNEVLPSNAFSAFDIETSTSVQAARILAIIQDDASFNLICDHVFQVVSKRLQNTLDTDDEQKSFPIEIPNATSSGDLSTSTYESSLMSLMKKSSFSERAAARILKQKKRTIVPFILPIVMNEVMRPSGEVLAANFVSFLQQISCLTGKASPYGNENPYLASVVTLATKKHEYSKQERKTLQDLVFHNEKQVVDIFLFLHCVCCHNSSNFRTIFEVSAQNITENEKERRESDQSPPELKENLTNHTAQTSLEKDCHTLQRSNKEKNPDKNSTINKRNSDFLPKYKNLNNIFPKTSPSPFETAVWNDPSIVLSILSFLGNPVSICMVKRLNVFCNRLVTENEHILMRDAVRLGGMSKFVRPSFWLWVTLERCTQEDPIPTLPSWQMCDNSKSNVEEESRNFVKLKEIGAACKWQHVIERDVTRAFGNMPPHKMGAKYRQDSIVKALISFGKEEIMRTSRSHQTMDKLPEGSAAQHFKLSSHLDLPDDSSKGNSEAPTDTVSDWGGISPVGSMVSEEPSASASDDITSITVLSLEGGSLEVRTKPNKLNPTQVSKYDVCDPVLSGNALTNDMKLDLQNKLRSILHALAAQHVGLGYCQGMDYVVAHLLRVLQDTILLRAIQGSLPHLSDTAVGGNLTCNTSSWRTMPTEQLRSRMNEVNSQSLIVEEVVFHVMDKFFTIYNLQHMYWPELRCLKTCCKVFERLITQKLPVLADHFEHHDLNVGLFALGWFQTLFLYLPSMPSATVCHMWDIWLVERSFKIFFRAGTAILFLSQPTLLNHDLEGMMTYLNTFPDATLLRRDILIPCALQIKITNQMLVEIEMDVANILKCNN